MSKKTKKSINDTENEITNLKSKMYDLSTRIDEVINRLNEISIVFDYHAHPILLMSEKPQFLKHQYEEAIKQQQQQQNVQQNLPEIEPKPTGEEREE